MSYALAAPATASGPKVGEVRRERFQRKNAARAMRARPATAPTTMPAIAPPEREELSSESDSESESESASVGVDDGAVVSDSVVEGSTEDVEAVVEVTAVVVGWARSSSSTERLVAQGVSS